MQGDMRREGLLQGKGSFKAFSFADHSMSVPIMMCALPHFLKTV